LFFFSEHLFLKDFIVMDPAYQPTSPPPPKRPKFSTNKNMVESIPPTPGDVTSKKRKVADIRF
jgi:hypothetical protein